MKELPIDLHNRCRDLLLECDEFRSNESVQSIFHGTEIVEYVRYIHEKDNPGDRIDDLLKALENKVCKGKSVLALFLEALGKRQPDGDRTGAELMRLAHEVAQFLRLENPSLTHTAQADFH